MSLKKKYASKTEAKNASGSSGKRPRALQFLVDIVPQNFMKASTNNKNMLQVIFFAILFGIAMIMLPDEKTLYVNGFFDGVNDVILQIVDIIMMTAPYGVFALLASLMVDFSDGDLNNVIELFSALGLYSLAVVTGLLIMILVVYPIILRLFTKMNYLDFLKELCQHRC